MYLEIVSPEATLFKGDVDSVSVPGVNGEFEMLNNHAPIISLLKAGDVKISGNNISLNESVAAKFKKHQKGYALSISSGTVEMKDNKIIVLAD